MYLLKQSNSVYYSRVCSPKSLLDIGYSFDIKVSLLTKDRATALLRNLYVSAIIKQSLLNQDPLINKKPLSFRQFKRGLDEQLENVRINQFKTCAYPIPALTTCLSPEQEKNNGVTDNGELLSLFPATLSNNDFMAIYEGDETLMPHVLTENKELAEGLYNKWMEHRRQ